MIASRNSAVSRTITDVIPSSRVRVAISYGTDRPLAEAIQSSLKLAGQPRKRPAATTELSGSTELLRHTEFAQAIKPRTPKPRTPKPRAASSHAPAKPSAQQAIFTGSGFDSCAAPSANAMTKWLSSGFRAVGVYIGGANRACAQANLTPAWLTTISGQGWHYFAIYPGLQSSCVQASGDATIVTSQAGQEGKAAANDAVAQATSLGIPAGAPLIFDMEAYGPSCDNQVTTFLSAWDKQIEARGYTSGVYESFTNIGALVDAADSITEPQVIYYADWDGNADDQQLLHACLDVAQPRAAAPVPGQSPGNLRRRKHRHRQRQARREPLRPAGRADADDAGQEVSAPHRPRHELQRHRRVVRPISERHADPLLAGAGRIADLVTDAHRGPFA